MADSKVDALIASFKDLTAVSTDAQKALSEVNNVVLKTGQGMEGLRSVVDHVDQGLLHLNRGIGELITSIPGLGKLGGAFEAVSTGIKAVGGAVDFLAASYIGAIKLTDELSTVNRTLIASNFALAAQFGGTLEEAEKFTEYMLSSAPRLATAEFGYQSLSENLGEGASKMANSTIQMVSALAQSRISFDRMQETIQTTIGVTDLYSVSLLQAQALGLSMGEYAGLVSDAMLKQGMSTQEAVEVLSLYGDVSERTGLTVKVVAESLGGLGLNFRKMGLDANFGQSFLESFVDVLEETGIGIENAADLTKSFGETVARLGTNYGPAYITAMRGGLPMGSGGALGAGIQMQARMMNPGEDQAALGKDLATAIRETISSFTGGRIVTVGEAASSGDSRTEETFYTQVKLLESMYGLQEQDAIRTLEMLEKLQSAVTSGDEELMASVGDDLSKSLGLREATMSNEEKLNAIVTAQLAELNVHTKLLGIVASQFTKETLVDGGASLLTEGLDQMRAGLTEINPDILALITSTREGSGSILDQYGASGSRSELFKSLESQGANAGNRAGEGGSELERALRGTTMEVKSTQLEALLTRLINAVGGQSGQRTNNRGTSVPGQPGANNSP